MCLSAKPILRSGVSPLFGIVFYRHLAPPGTGALVCLIEKGVNTCHAFYSRSQSL
jgi:hypothetical protein